MIKKQKKPVYGAPPAGYAGPKRSLVLAGGGMRVAYQAGVIRALLEHNLCFHHADGTSGGTMNLAMLLSGHSPADMCGRWRTLDVKKFVSMLPFNEYLRLHKAKALGSAEGIADEVFPHLGIDVGEIRKSGGMQGTFNVCNYTDKINESIPHQEIALDLLLAGISLPIFMPVVHYQNKKYMDAVWIKDANLTEAVKRGAEEIWLVWCIGNHDQYRDGLFNQYVHMIEMSANGALFEEFDRIRELNKRIRRGDSPYGQEQPVKLHVIKPEYPLPLDPDYFFNRIDAATLISMGYADAVQYLDKRDKKGVSWTPAATKMKNPVPGIAFREKMEGWFALHETDPKQGADAGKEQGSSMSLHASIYIRDLEAFMENTDHSGTMNGYLVFEDFDNYLPAKTGIFNLFVENDNDTEIKRMIYEMSFSYDDREYYLAGKKEVKDNPGLDLWKDTTTLNARLFEGSDSTGNIVGAGILTLEVKELVKLIKNMRAIDASGTAEKINLLANFGTFFLGELWDTYGD